MDINTGSGNIKEHRRLTKTAGRDVSSHAFWA